MKESRKEFIIEAHKNACSEWQGKIEEEFPKLFKKRKYKVGDWVIGFFSGVDKYCKRPWVIGGFTDKDGFAIPESNKEHNTRLSSIRKATEEEIEEHLIEEAKKRGFKKGVMVDGRRLGKYYYENEKMESLDFNYGLSNDVLSLGHYAIYKDGKWAEIIPQEKEMTKEQIEEELGYKISIV